MPFFGFLIWTIESFLFIFRRFCEIRLLCPHSISLFVISYYIFYDMRYMIACFIIGYSFLNVNWRKDKLLKSTLGDFVNVLRLTFNILFFYSIASLLIYKRYIILCIVFKRYIQFSLQFTKKAISFQKTLLVLCIDVEKINNRSTLHTFIRLFIAKFIERDDKQGIPITRKRNMIAKWTEFEEICIFAYSLCYLVKISWLSDFKLIS